MTGKPIELSREQARRLAVSAQLLDAERPGDVIEVAEQLARIKIDPTAHIATAEHTALFSRIGWQYEPGHLKKAVERDRLLFEFDGTFRPVSLLPAMLPVMTTEHLHSRTREWLEANAAFHKRVVAQLRADGPLPASAIADTAAVAHHSESGWYGPGQVPRLLEVLQLTGEVAVSRREGRNRVWDLAERVYPAVTPLSETEAEETRAARRLQAAGIAKQKSSWSGVGTAGLAARVEGSSWTFRVDPEALARLDHDPGGRIAILNPYDTMLFDRPRLKELFDFTYVLEQFKPKDQRVYGYFAHPILIGDTFAGLLDAQFVRNDRALHVTAIHELTPWQDEDRDAVHAELSELAEWLGADLTGLP